jgi:hypothetical protein
MEPREPVSDVWPPKGFATDDLDIVAERDADEAVDDFDLDLNRADTEPDAEPEPYTPTAAESAAAIEAAEQFEYDTGVEDDESHPGPAAVDEPAVRVAGPFAAEAPTVIREPAPSWRDAPAPLAAHDRPGGGAGRTIAGVIGGVALGLFLGWAIFSGDRQSDTPATQPPPVTEVPVPAPSTPAPAAPAPATDATPAAPTTGRLLVRSTPSGAVVRINGEWSGRTPFTKRDMPFGEYTIRVVYEAGGYDPVNQRITLTPGNPSRELAVDLPRRAGQAGRAGQTPIRQPRETAPPAGAPAPSNTGTLTISSRPAGARVLVDGRFVGNTPAKVAGVSAGSHTVRVELEGYRPWSTTVRVSRNQDARVAAPLIPQDNR